MDPVSVCHVTFSSKGGAGRVSQALHQGMRDQGSNSSLLTLTSGDIKTVLIRYPKIFMSGFTDFYFVRKSRQLSLFSLLRSQTSVNLPHDLSSSLGILHLHWTPGVIGSDSLTKVASNFEKVVWTLHDMFPFTGGCHHSMDCDGFLSDCSNCPQVRSAFRKRVEGALVDKVEGVRSVQSLSVVTPSKWLYEKARNSKVFENAAISIIPNPVDTSVFRPAHFIKNRKHRKLVVGCNATNLLDPMKGIVALLDVLETFQTKYPEVDVELVAIGRGKLPVSRVKIRQSGFISNASDIVQLYQEMDVFISLSLAEVFPLSIAEAQSCGVPVICLNSGGMPEMIDQGVDGFVVESSENLLQRLNIFCDESVDVVSLGLQSRAKAITQYSTSVVVRKYLDLYTQVLGQ
jgi:glycosyltransferase involved in cell wall biosynthesis